MVEKLKELTLEEKAALVEGCRSWYTNSIPQKEIPRICLTDGPLGVRHQAEGTESIGLGAAEPATAFPAPVNVANTWDEEAAEQVGRAMGEEAAAHGVNVLLGPGLNIKRDPRGGRNFEYFSEDPLVSGTIAAAVIRGIESTGTVACMKHYAANNSENFRIMGDSVLDVRALREIYLKGFEIAAKKGKPGAVMCSYNRVNGKFASENRKLLTEILRDEWGYEGLTMTDWGATHDRVEGIAAGLDLDMPGGVVSNREAIIEAVKKGDLPEEMLDRAVLRVLALIEHCLKQPVPSKSLDELNEEGAALAADIASKSAVLLKNDGLLPLEKGEKVLVIGELFTHMRYQGAGSSGVYPARLLTPEDAFIAAGVNFGYSKGFSATSSEINETDEEAALDAAKNAGTVLLFLGLTEDEESEGEDRKSFSLPENQLSLVEKLTSMEEGPKRIVAVLFGGSPFAIPFEDKVGAILNMYLPGETGGDAVRRLLFGEANPEGKLTETWAKSEEDIPFGALFAKRKTEEYRENIFVGYRYYLEAPEKVRYPFGFGLSYTSFDVSKLAMKCKNGVITVSAAIKNTGDRAGAEVLQVYAGRNRESGVFKAQRELRGFKKVRLEPGKKASVEISFPVTDLSFYDSKDGRWVLENGTYPIYAGTSSDAAEFVGILSIVSGSEPVAVYSKRTLEAYGNIADCSIPDEVFRETIRRPIPPEPPKRPYTMESCIMDFEESFFGRAVLSLLQSQALKTVPGPESVPEGPEREALRKGRETTMLMMRHMSPRALLMNSGGAVNRKQIEMLVAAANGNLGGVISSLFKK